MARAKPTDATAGKKSRVAAAIDQDDGDQLPMLSPQEQALAKARRNGRVRGWAEGGGTVIGAALIVYFWKIFLFIAILGAAGYAGYRYIKRDKAIAGEPEEGEE
jgi:hypothetical protein